jgi:hypothetical protein
MEHIIMGGILLLSALLLIAIAVVVSPKLGRLGSIHGFSVDHTRYSFAAVMIILSIYMGQIAILFFKDHLGSENYVIELWGVRILLLLALIHFLVGAIRADV